MNSMSILLQKFNEEMLDVGQKKLPAVPTDTIKAPIPQTTKTRQKNKEEDDLMELEAWAKVPTLQTTNKRQKNKEEDDLVELEAWASS